MDLRAILMGLAFAFMWSSAFTSARIIVADASPLFSLALRFLISGLIGVAIARAMGQSWRLSRSQWYATILFGICQNALYLGLNFVAMQTVEAGFAAIIASVMPLLVALASWLLLGERLTRLKVLAALAGFIGILIVARPSPDTLNAGVISAASAAVFFALTGILTKRLTRRESTASILLWLTLMQLAMGVAAAGWDGRIALPPADTLPWLVVIGLAGLTAHFCLTTALSLAPATVVVPVDFARLPVIALAGMLIYGEQLDIWVIAGAAVIFGANYANLVLGQKRKFRIRKT